jgi:flagellin-specific chaperone FliS
MGEHTKEEALSSKYEHSNAMTAGRVQTILLLLKKAKELVRSVNLDKILESGEKIRHTKNIIAQLEMSLNFRDGLLADEIMELYELIYRALENSTEKSLKNAYFLLGHFKETLEIAVSKKKLSL